MARMTRKELNATAANINASSKEEQQALGRHLLARHGHKVTAVGRDRMQSLADGFGADATLVEELNLAGVSL